MTPTPPPSRGVRWPRTLLGRHLALLVVLIVLGQLCAALLLRQLVLLPRAAQAADGVVAHMVALRAALQAVPPAERAAFVQRYNAAQADPAPSAPLAAWRARPSSIERYFQSALDRQWPPASPQGPPAWRRDAHGTLWLHLALDGQDHWLRLPRLFVLREPTGAWLGAMVLGLMLALLGVWRLQRHLARPLQHVVQAAQAIAQGQPHQPLPEQGPHELATVAHSINHMAHALAQADAERALMLAGVSHDLRTPLTKLRLAVEIAHPRLDDDMATSMTRSIETMDAIVGQFLDFARAQVAEPLVRESLNDLASAVAQAQADHGRPLTLALGDAPPCPVQPQLLRRAIDNLVENAWRHGAPPVALRTGHEATGIWIEVQDHGPGVPAADLERIRAPFARGDAQARHGAPGAGLGLAIVERAARAHGGRLTLHSPASGGLVARITLPAG